MVAPPLDAQRQGRGSENVPKLPALNPDLFLLPLLPGPLAAALPLATRLRLVWIAASSVCSPVARCESAAKVHDQSTEPPPHRSPTATYAARQSGAQTCSPHPLVTSCTELLDAAPPPPPLLSLKVMIMLALNVAG